MGARARVGAICARAGMRRSRAPAPIVGRAVVLGDDVNTDIIIAGKHCRVSDPVELGRRIFEGTELEGRIKGGEVVIAGRNMGMGSSREQAPLALKAAGVRAVVAESFGRIFFRNAINIGLPVMRAPGLRKNVREGQRVSLDVGRGALKNLDTGEVIKGELLPPILMEILIDGGLVPHIRKRISTTKDVKRGARGGGGPDLSSSLPQRRRRAGRRGAADARCAGARKSA